MMEQDSERRKVTKGRGKREKEESDGERSR